MNYSLEQVTTTADCDELLQVAANELDDLDFRKRQQNRSYQAVSTGSTTVETELALVTAEISSLEAVVAGLPDGPTKSEMESRLQKLRHKKFLLGERKERYGILALLQKEFAISCIEKQITETEVFIAEIQQRKEEIG